MRTRTLFLLLILLLLSSCTVMSILTKFKRGEPVYPLKAAVIDFDLQGHKILLPVGVNAGDMEHTFLFDTGAMTAISIRLADSLGLAPGVALPTPIDSIEVHLTEKPLSVNLPGVSVEDMYLVRFDFSKTFKISQVQGFIGSNLLRHFCVLIDYSQRQLILSRDYPEWVSKVPSFHLDMKTSFPLYFPVIECTLNDHLPAEGMLDTGSPFLLVIPLELFEETILDSGADYIAAEGVMVKWPYTTSDDCYLARLPSISFGELHLTDIPVVIADLPSAGEHMLLGKDFLDQFQTVLNYPESELLLVPLGEPQFPDNLISTGLKVTRREDKTVVRGFWQGSSADRQGVRVGDELLEIAGHKTADLTMNEVREFLTDEAAAFVEVIIEQDGENRLLTLTREPLLP
jgi:predicted aspartyl protease